MNNRRSEPRFMCADLVKVHIQDAAGTREVIANLEDISASGACIQLEAAAVEGADVEMICAKCNLKGKVRYCRFTELGYDVGIAFAERRRWSRKRFAPKHLLEVPVSDRATEAE
jgi:PilZ domain